MTNIFAAVSDSDDDLIVYDTVASSEHTAEEELANIADRENEGVEWHDEDDCYVDEDGDEVSYFDTNCYNIVEFELERVS